MIGASFDSTKTPLQDLLARGDTGSLQLPDVQRGWVWDDERIRSLPASVPVSFPIGAVMLLQTGGEHVRCKPRPLTGSPPRVRDLAPEALVLDGQQRLTSLYQAPMGREPVETKDAKGKPIRRWYYLDMKAAVRSETDREYAVPSVPERAAGIDAARMDAILASHCIAPETLRANDFWDFYAARAEALLTRIERATGKSVPREPGLFEAGVTPETYDEGPEEWDVEEPLEEAAS